MDFFNKNIAIIKKIKSIPQEAIAGEKLDLITKTLNILSKKINKKPRVTPIAKLLPVPPLLLNEDTDKAINVSMKHDKGIVYLLCLTSRCELIKGEPALFSYLIKSFNSKKLRVSAT